MYQDEVDRPITLLTRQDIADFKAEKTPSTFETRLIENLESEWETVRSLNGTIYDAALEIERLQRLIAGVIDRCAATGYVGADGQYLKELQKAAWVDG